MKSKQEKRKVPKPVMSTVPGTVLITLLITLLFAALIYVMYIFNIVSFFDLSGYFAESDDTAALIDEHGTLYDELNGDAFVDDYVLLYKVTPDELTSILSTFENKTDCKFTAETVNYGAGSNKVTRITAERQQDKFEIDKYIGGVHTESIDSDGVTIVVTDELRNRSARHSDTDNFQFEALCMMPSLDELVSVCNDVLNEEENSVINYDISLVSSDNQSYYKVVFTYPDISQKEEYYISPDSQMIVSAYSYFNDSLYYRYSLLEFTDTSL